MKVTVYDWYTDIILTPEEMDHLCTPGRGDDTCIWLVLGAEGFECSCLNRPSALIDRWREGKTNAKRDGCAFVASINISKLGLGEHEVEVPGVTKL